MRGVSNTCVRITLDLKDTGKTIYPVNQSTPAVSPMATAKKQGFTP